MISDPPLRRGFSLFELIFVLFVILVLIMVLVPGIHRAREVARRTQCGNNLKQIGLALHNYHDAHSVYPPGYVTRNVAPTDPAVAEGPGYAWGALLLPYVDQQPLYQTIDFAADTAFGPALGAAPRSIACYRCPTDTSNTSMSYVGSYGFGSLTLRPGAPEVPGVFYRNSNVPEFDIRDGSSHTFLVGERAGVHDFVPGEPAVDAGAEWLSVYPFSFRPAGISDDLRVEEGPASLVLGTVGQDEPVPVHAVHRNTNHVAAFSSRHQGGAHFGLADGSVHFLAETIDDSVYRALAGRKDGGPTRLPTEF